MFLEQRTARSGGFRVEYSAMLCQRKLANVSRVPSCLLKVKLPCQLADVSRSFAVSERNSHVPTSYKSHRVTPPLRHCSSTLLSSPVPVHVTHAHRIWSRRSLRVSMLLSYHGTRHLFVCSAVPSPQSLSCQGISVACLVLNIGKVSPHSVTQQPSFFNTAMKSTGWRKSYVPLVQVATRRVVKNCLENNNWRPVRVINQFDEFAHSAFQSLNNSKSEMLKNAGELLVVANAASHDNLG